MGILIGMDEAGYGPNLGPLVITLTAWRVPGHPAEFDLWDAFGDVVTSQPDASDRRLCIADSKRVYQSSGSLAALERTVLAALRLLDLPGSDYHTLCGELVNGRSAGDAEDGTLRGFPDVAGAPALVPVAGASALMPFDDPAVQDASLQLPCCPEIAEGIAPAADAWLRSCRTSDVTLQAVHSDVIWPERFNRLLQSHGNKAEMLTRLSLQLLSRIWSPGADSEGVTLIFADKHGGRNRYDRYLQDIANGAMVFRLQESPAMSRYRIGRDDIRFCRGGESHLPVALASMTSKYLRELSMMLFNRFWERHVSGIKPTKGYPVDAKRFRSEISEVQQRLGIADDILWRQR